MDLQNLKEHHEELLSFMENNGYCSTYIRRFRDEINHILADAGSHHWQSYQDIYLEYLKVPHSKDYLRNKRTIIGAPEQFDRFGRFPDGRHRHTLFERGSYHLLEPEFQELIDFYRLHEKQRGKKESTIRGESLNTASFLYRMQEQGARSLDEVTEDAVLSFFVSEDGLLQKGCSHKKNISAVFKAGLKWKESQCRRILGFLPMLRETRKNIQYLTQDEVRLLRDAAYMHFYLEAAQVPRRKCQKKKVEGLTREAVKALLDAPSPLSRTGRRDMAFLILLYSTAARLDELLSMKNSQLHLSNEKPYAVIIGKGNKIRTLYLLPKTVAHLKRYLAEFHGETPDPEAYVFYSRNTGSHGKLTRPAISKMLRKYAKAAHEVCSDVHAHQLRHSKASHWPEDGMNIIQISFLLGHEQLQTTMVYLDITAEEKAKALSTLEDENDRKVSAKWKNPDGSLVDFCGFRRKR